MTALIVGAASCVPIVVVAVCVTAAELSLITGVTVNAYVSPFVKPLNVVERAEAAIVLSVETVLNVFTLEIDKLSIFMLASSEVNIPPVVYSTTKRS